MDPGNQTARPSWPAVEPRSLAARSGRQNPRSADPDPLPPRHPGHHSGLSSPSRGNHPPPDLRICHARFHQRFHRTAAKLAKLAKEAGAKVNLIPYNKANGAFTRPSRETIKRFGKYAEVRGSQSDGPRGKRCRLRRRVRTAPRLCKKGETAMIRILGSLLLLSCWAPARTSRSRPRKSPDPRRDPSRNRNLPRRRRSRPDRSSERSRSERFNAERHPVPGIAAATRQNPVLVEILLENGANAKMTDETGETPLHAAVGSSKTNVTRMLPGTGGSECARPMRTDSPDGGGPARKNRKCETPARKRRLLPPEDEFGRNVISYAALAPENGKEILELFVGKKEPLMPRSSDLENPRC